MFLSSRWLNKDQPGRVPQADPLGIGLAVVAFGSLLYAATIASELGWTAASTLTWFAIGLVALLIFGIVELFVVKEPLLDLRLFKSRNFTIATLIGLRDSAGAVWARSS